MSTPEVLFAINDYEQTDDDGNPIILGTFDSYDNAAAWAEKNALNSFCIEAYEDECGYCGDSQDPNDICHACFSNLP